MVDPDESQVKYLSCSCVIENLLISLISVNKTSNPRIGQSYSKGLGMFSFWGGNLIYLKGETHKHNCPKFFVEV